MFIRLLQLLLSIDNIIDLKGFQRGIYQYKDDLISKTDKKYLYYISKKWEYRLLWFLPDDDLYNVPLTKDDLFDLELSRSFFNNFEYFNFIDQQLKVDIN